MSEDGTKQEGVKIEGVKKEAVKKEVVKKEPARKESIKRESESSLPPAKRSKSSSSTPKPQVKKEQQPAKTTKPVFEIIDGSDLRKFLNKNLTPYLVKGLNELSENWRQGKYKMDEASVLKEFTKILQSYTDEIHK